MTVSCTRIVLFMMAMPSIVELDHVVTDGQLPQDSRLVTADMEEVRGTDVMPKPLGTSISVKASAPVTVEDLCSEDSYLERPICTDAQWPATTELTVSDSIMERAVIPFCLPSNYLLDNDCELYLSNNVNGAAGHGLTQHGGSGSCGNRWPTPSTLRAGSHGYGHRHGYHCYAKGHVH